MRKSNPLIALIALITRIEDVMCDGKPECANQRMNNFLSGSGSGSIAIAIPIPIWISIGANEDGQINE